MQTDSEQPAVEQFKRAAAERALELVRPGMLVGLGTGSTARYFMEGLGDRVRKGLRIQAIATSRVSAERAQSVGIPLLDAIDGTIDLAVDGADEVDPMRNCIKGRGGALLREKIVAGAARRFIVIADESKAVSQLGVGPVPVEVLPFLWQLTSRRIQDLGGKPVLRQAGAEHFLTDNGNLILDVSFGLIAEPEDLGLRLQTIPGVIEHGLFIGMAQCVIFAGPAGLRVLGDL